MGITLGGGSLTPDDLDRHARDSAIRDQAIKWFEKMDPEIAALAGRESTSVERGVARLIVFLELGARIYGDLRKELGDVIAQDVLKQGIPLLGGILRRNGEAVRMSVSLEFYPLTATEPDQHYASVKEEDKETCQCTLDQDGRCETCIGTLRNFFHALDEVVRITREAGAVNRPACRPCALRHMDATLAEYVRRDLSTVNPDIADSSMKMMFVTAQSLQAMPMPLTTRAWDELLNSRGGGTA